MVFEIATIQIASGTKEGFVEAVRQAAPLFKAAKGCRSFALDQSIEFPDKFRLIVGWDSVEDHMVTFRESPAYAGWRELVSPFFAEPPQVEHVRPILDEF